MPAEMVDTTSAADTQRPSFRVNTTSRLIVGAVVLLTAQISQIVIARALGPNGKGVASILILTASVAVILTDLGLTTSGVYFVGRRKYTAQSIVSTYLTTGVVVGLVTTIVMVALCRPLANLLFNGSYPELIVLLALGIPAGLLSRWLAGALRGLEEIVKLSYVNALESVAGLAALAITLFLLKQGQASVVWGANATVVFSLIATAYLIRQQGIRLSFGMNREILKESLCYGMKGQAGQILQWINYRFDLFIVNALRTRAELGIYSVAAGVPTLIWQVPNAIAFALYSRVSVLDKEGGDQVAIDSARHSALASLLLAAAFVPISRYAIPILFGKAFSSAIVATWLLLPGTVALSYYKTLGVHLAGQGKPEYGSYAGAVSVVLTIALDFLLIPEYGINGAAVASSIAYTVTGAITIYWFVRMTGCTKISKLFVPQPGDLRTWISMIRQSPRNGNKSGEK